MQDACEIITFKATLKFITIIILDFAIT